MRESGEFRETYLHVEFGAFAFHPDRRQLLRHGEEVHLTPKAFDLLALLVERAPAVVSKRDAHTRLWPDTFVSDATLVGLVKELRRALSDDRQGTIIRTVHSVGYAFAGCPGASTPPQATRASICWLVAGARRIPLQEGINEIGRDPGAAVFLDVVSVSRRHAQIRVEQGKAFLEDLGSKNGTLVEGLTVRESAALRDSDRIQIGTELLVFHAADTGVPTATQPVPPGPLQKDRA